MNRNLFDRAAELSAGASRERRRRRGCPSASERSASRTTTGCAHDPPTQPSIEPSGWTMPCAPGFADVGRRTATTVANANGRPAATSSAALAYRDAGPPA